MSLFLTGVSTEASRTVRCRSDAEDILSKYPPGDSASLHEAHTGQRGSLLKRSLNSRQRGTNKVGAMLLTSEATVMVLDLPTSFGLSPLCDLSIVVSETGSI